jgi:CubicO group peptidase (beta-lactamase class C family)
LAFAAPALSQQKGGKPGKPDPSASDAGIVRGEVGAILEKTMHSPKWFPDGFCGSVLVAKGGEVLLEKSYGLADDAKKTPIATNALWDWCSITKQFTAAGVLRLEQEKKLSIDDAITKIFPKAPADKSKVTLRHLLNHTSGIEGGKFEGIDPFDREAVVKHILAQKLGSEPGSKWEYSNQAYFLLAALIEKVSGQPYERYMKEHLFKPAALQGATFIGEPDCDLRRVPLDDRGRGVAFAYGTRMSWGYRGAGGAVLTVRDMYLWDRALAGTKVLDDARKAKLYDVGLQGYALGWEVSRDSGKLRYEHSGHTGKVVTYYLRKPDSGIVVALAYSYEPQPHPKIVAANLALVARNGKAPPDFDK